MYKTTLSNNSTSPVRHDGNSTVKDILKENIKQQVLEISNKKPTPKLDDSYVSAGDRFNRFQRLERNLVKAIQDENVKMSDDLLNKSA